MAIVSVLLVVILSALGQVSSIWQRMSDKVDSFQNARLAFDLLTTNLRRATLNAYVGYDDPQNPSRYQRLSELAFVSGPVGHDGLPGTPGTGHAVFFQLPDGYTDNPTTFGKLKSLLNTCGYFVRFQQNSSLPGHVKDAANPWRYRLMQVLAPAEKNSIYSPSSFSSDWFAQFAPKAAPVADNVIALVIRAENPAVSPADLSADYSYDSRRHADDSPQPPTAHQLPPVVALTMIVLDEKSALRLENGDTPPAVIVEALAGKFADQSDDQFESDLKEVESTLQKAHVAYRVYSSAVSLQESKWAP